MDSKFVNIFKNIGIWLQNRNLSWLLPKKEESSKESCISILQIIFLIPLLFVLLLIRLIVLIINLIKTTTNGKISTQGRTYIPFTHIKIALYSIFIALLVFIELGMLYKKAKQNNVNLIEIRNYSFVTPPIYDCLPENNYLQTVYKAIYLACEQEYSSQAVVKLRKDLFIDDDFAKDLHFIEPTDFVAYLYSLKGIDKDVTTYLKEVEKHDEINGLVELFRTGALEDYVNGDYYSAAEMTEHYFNLYNNYHHYAIEAQDVDNEMHILRLLLQHRWALSTNRSFSSQVISDMEIIGDSINTNKKEELSFLSEEKYTNVNVKEICKYFAGVSAFHLKNYKEAIGIFEECFNNTTDNLLKQYCALMIIRTAFWNYDKTRTLSNLSLYNKLFSEFSSSVSLPYFLPDLQRYEEIVKG